MLGDTSSSMPTSNYTTLFETCIGEANATSHITPLQEAGRERYHLPCTHGPKLCEGGTDDPETSGHATQIRIVIAERGWVCIERDYKQTNRQTDKQTQKQA